MTSLDTLQPGDRARLASVGGGRGFRRRLLEMGLLPGTEVWLVRRAELGGLVELVVRGAHLSLRRKEAREVVVEKVTATVMTGTRAVDAPGP